MTELLIALLVLGGAMIVFYPVLGGSGTPRPAPSGRAGAADAPELEEERAELVEQKRRVLRNLKELEADHAAGRVSAEDYATLRERDQAEAAQLIQQIEVVEADLRGGRRPRRKPAPAPVREPARPRAARAAAWAGGIMVFGALVVFTMSRAITDREPGGTITGTIPGGPGPGPAAGGSGGASALMPKADPVRLAALERQVRGDSTNLAALLEAGHLYLAEQRFDEAARVTLRALRINRDSPEAYAHIGVLLFAESSSHDDPDSARAAVDGAIQAVDHALKLKPDLAEGWLFKGMISMAGLRDPAAAADAWEQYLKVAPKGADTSRIAAMVRGMKGR